MTNQTTKGNQALVGKLQMQALLTHIRQELTDGYKIHSRLPGFCSAQKSSNNLKTSKCRVENVASLDMISKHDDAGAERSLSELPTRSSYEAKKLIAISMIELARLSECVITITMLCHE